MKRFFLNTLQAASLTWVALTFGIITTSVLYTILVIAGATKNTSLLVAFIVLIGLIPLCLFLPPKFFPRSMGENETSLPRLIFPQPTFKIIGLLTILTFVLVFPLAFKFNYNFIVIAVFMLLFASVATAWNIFSGYTGYISLGHATFYGIGAYTLALICQSWNIDGGYIPFLLLPLVGLITGAFAALLGWIALRINRQVFSVLTIVIFFIFQNLAYNLTSISNGASGIFLPLPPWSANAFYMPFYYISFILLVLAICLSWRIRHSKYGLRLLAIRDDEERVLGLGVKTGLYKLSAFAISAIFVGMAGGLGVYFVGSIYPNMAFDPAFDITIVLMTFIGGFGTLAGPIIGAFIVEPLQQFLTLQYGDNGLVLLIFGMLLLVIVLVLPNGIVPALQSRWTAWMTYRSRMKTERSVPHVTKITNLK